MNTRNYAIAGMLAPAIFLITYLIMSTSRPEYSNFTKAVSELGSVDAPNKLYWNFFGYIIPGMLIMLFSFGLKNHFQIPSYKTPFIGMALSGFFMAFSGVFPGDFDNKLSLISLLHAIGSFGSYIAFLFAAFTFPKLLSQYEAWKNLRKPLYILTFASLLFGNWPFIFTDMPSIGQRFVFLCYFGWFLLISFRLYASGERKTMQQNFSE
jgi:hypothetical membrane protein